MSDETPDGLQFDQAEFADGQGGSPSVCALCAQPLQGSYYTLNGHSSCETCKAGFVAQFQGGSGFARFLKATVFGVIGGLIGATIYYGVAKIAGYELALISIATGWLVGKGVSIGNGHRGGKRYQLLAVAITWAAIAAAFVPFMDEAFQQEAAAREFVQPAAAETPVEGTTNSGDAGDSEPAAPGSGDEFEFTELPLLVRWAIYYPFAFALPFLNIAESPMGVLILLIGLWTAWGTNKKVEFHVSGPHALAPPSPAAGTSADPMPPSDPLPPSG
jgi:hypothetical protein